MKVHSLSWINPDAFAESLARAGVGDITRGASRLGASAFWSPTTNRPAASDAAPMKRSPRATQPVPRQIPTYAPPAGALVDRLNHYVNWVSEQTGCRQIFVADSDGLVLVESNADPDLVAISSMFVGVLNRVDASLSSPMRGSIVIDLELGGSLHVVQAETGLGPHSVGFAVSQPASRQMIDGARDGLIRVMSPLEDADDDESRRPTESVAARKTPEASSSSVENEEIPSRREEPHGR